MGIIERLFGASPTAKADIAAGELQEIISEFRRITTDNSWLLDELVKRDACIEKLHQVRMVRIDPNYTGVDMDGVRNMTPSELMSSELAGDVSIDASDLRSIIAERDRYHGALIKQSCELRTALENLTKANNNIQEMRVTAAAHTSVKKINLTGLASELGIKFDTRI